MSKASVHFPRPAVLSFVPVALLGLLMMASAVAGSAASRSLATAPDITMPTAEEWRRLRDGEVLVAGETVAAIDATGSEAGLEPSTPRRLKGFADEVATFALRPA